jgi:hypothetical protein
MMRCARIAPRQFESDGEKNRLVRARWRSTLEAGRSTATLTVASGAAICFGGRLGEGFYDPAR